MLYKKAQGELGQTTIKSVDQNNLNILSPQTDVLNGVTNGLNFHKFNWGIVEISQNWKLWKLREVISISRKLGRI